MKYIFVVLGFWMSFESKAQEDGGCIGHGGGDISREVYRLSFDFYQAFKSMPKHVRYRLRIDFSPGEFLDALNSITYKPQATPVIVGSGETYREEVFGNFPGKIVRIWIDGYRNLDTRVSTKRGLSIHETLGVLKEMTGKGEWDIHETSLQLNDWYETTTVLFPRQERDEIVVKVESIMRSHPVPSDFAIFDGVDSWPCVTYSKLSDVFQPVTQESQYFYQRPRNQLVRLVDRVVPELKKTRLLRTSSDDVLVIDSVDEVEICSSFAKNALTRFNNLHDEMKAALFNESKNIFSLEKYYKGVQDEIRIFNSWVLSSKQAYEVSGPFNELYREFLSSVNATRRVYQSKRVSPIKEKINRHKKINMDEIERLNGIVPQLHRVLIQASIEEELRQI